LRKRNEGERGKSARREKEMRSKRKRNEVEGDKSERMQPILFFFNCLNFVAALATGKSPAFFEFV
jgi:hypothetical protein